VRERDVVPRDLVRVEERELEDVVVGCGHSVGDPRAPVEIHGRDLSQLGPVPVHEDADELGVAQADSRLLAQLPVKRVERMLALFDEAARQVQLAGGRLVRSPREHHAALVVDHQGGCGGLRVRVLDEPALGAFDAALIAPDRRPAERAAPPGVELSHGSQQ
jgi:hypothetical protein